MKAMCGFSPAEAETAPTAQTRALIITAFNEEAEAARPRLPKRPGREEGLAKGGSAPAQAN